MICTFLISQITSLTLKGQTSQHTIQLHKLVHYKSTLIKFLHNPSNHSSFTGTAIIMRRALHHPDLQKLTQLLITILTVTSHMKSVLITHRRAVAILPTWQCTTLCITLAADFYPIVNIIIRTANKGAGVNTCPLGRQLCIKKKNIPNSAASSSKVYNLCYHWQYYWLWQCFLKSFIPKSKWCFLNSFKTVSSHFPWLRIPKILFVVWKNYM